MWSVVVHVHSPWYLIALTLVVAVAAMALLRPSRMLVSVGSLSLWRQVLGSGRFPRKTRRLQITLSWALLAAGAAAAVLAASRPVVHSTISHRKIAIGVYDTAEFRNPAAQAELTALAAEVLNRLASEDQVQLLLPRESASNWLSVSAARNEVARLEPLPLRADEAGIDRPDANAQHIYYIAPEAAKPPQGPGITTIAVPASHAPRIESIGAEPAAGDRVQVLVCVANPASRAWTGGIELTRYDANAKTIGRQMLNVEIAPAAAKAVVLECPAAAAFSGVLASDANVIDSCCLARRQVVKATIALAGTDQPLIRRFVEVNPELTLVGEANRADVVVCGGQAPPANKHALVIAPLSPPQTWRRGDELSNVVLAGPGVAAAADDPVMRDVDLANVAVRTAAAWLAPVEGGATYLTLLARGEQALIVRTAPEALSVAGGARRVYVSFDLTAENTTFGLSPSFVVFLANAIHWLAPARDHQFVYSFQTPSQSGPQGKWRAVAPPEVRTGGSGLPWPGVYCDAKGELHAVSLPGVQAAGTFRSPADRQARVGELPLPPPRFWDEGKEYWRELLIAAALLWLAGWAAGAASGRAGPSSRPGTGDGAV